jgi:putative component of membrane protein insertase Oxa1/YidC/SpoIIIJ protein YidD
LKYFFKFAIRLYWFIVPNSLKGVCLFEESCSKHVYRTLQNEGTKAGFKALVYRFKVCRSPFLIRKNKEKNQYELHLCNGDIIQENLINSYHLSNKN